MSETSTLTSMKFTVEDAHTIGVGIDTERRIFSVHYANMTYINHYHLKAKASKLNIMVREAGITGKSDVVKVNFGDKPFQHDIPFGYTSWGRNPNILTCYCKKRHGDLLFLNLFFVILITS